MLLAGAVLACSRSGRAEECDPPACPGGRCVDGRCVPTRPRAPDPPAIALRPLFELSLGERVPHPPTPTPDGHILVVTARGRVVRVDAGGTVTASHELGAPPAGALAVDALGRALVATLDGRLHVLSPALEARTSRPLEHGAAGPVTALETGLFAVATRGVELVSAEGTRVAFVASASMVRAGVADLGQEGFAFGAPHGELVVAGLDGTERARLAVDAGVTEAPLALPDGSLLVTDMLGHLHRFARSGEALPLPSTLGPEAALDIAFSPVQIGDQFAACSRDGVLRILGADLEPRAIVTLPGNSISARPSSDLARNVLVGTRIGFVASFDTTGHERARAYVGADVRVPPTLYADGVLLVVTDDGIARGFR